MSISPIATKTAGKLQVKVYESRTDMGQGAAAAVAARIGQVLATQPVAHMVFAAAPSQNEFLDALVATPGIDWSRIVAFHLDEYRGLPEHAPQRFATYLNQHIFARVPFRTVHFLNGNAEPAAECRRYGELLARHPLHIACIGIGENGHLAFNDPPVADFHDHAAVKVVELDQRCREQQVHDGCFPTVDAVPTHALTLTIPAIMAAQAIFCMVPGPTKQEAVQRTLNLPVSTECPATIMRTHKDAALFLDRAAAQLIL